MSSCREPFATPDARAGEARFLLGARQHSVKTLLQPLTRTLRCQLSCAAYRRQDAVAPRLYRDAVAAAPDEAAAPDAARRHGGRSVARRAGPGLRRPRRPGR